MVPKDAPVGAPLNQALAAHIQRMKIRTLLTYIAFTLMPFSIGVLLNTETSDAALLIFIGIALGVFLWIPYLIMQRKKESYSKFQVYCKNPKTSLIEYAFSYFIFLCSSVVLISLINLIQLRGNIVIEEGTVIGYTTRQIRHSKIEQLKIRISSGKYLYINQEQNKPKIGSVYRIKINKGLLNFPRVIDSTLIDEIGKNFDNEIKLKPESDKRS